MLLAASLALLFLYHLQDAKPVDAQETFNRAEALLRRGFPVLSQELAARGYDQFQNSNSAWAARFQALEAEALEWRGMYEETLRLMAAPSPAAVSGDEEIHKLVIEAVALIHLQDIADANKKVASAQYLCSLKATGECGEVIRAQGLLAMELGHFSEARDFFLKSLRVAREHSDRQLETTALLNLSAAAIQQERYDDAVDWSSSALKAAQDLGDENLAEAAMGNVGWAYLGLGDTSRALDLFLDAEKQAKEIGNVRNQLKWISAIGNTALGTGDSARALQSYRDALMLAKQIDSNEDIINSLEYLAHVSIDQGNLDDADFYLAQLVPRVQATASRLDDLDVVLAQAKIDAARHHDEWAKGLFRGVEHDPDSQTSMRMGAEHALARLFEAENNAKDANTMYRTALKTFEAARAELKDEDSKLPFLTNATPIYDDYIHFLVHRGQSRRALDVADQSRARTLAQGLGIDSDKPTFTPAALRPEEIARKANATLLFYWMGARQSYLWAITPRRTAVFALPAQDTIVPLIGRYRRALLGPEDPVEAANEDGRALYNLLVAPAARLIAPGAHVMVLTDGALSQLNFETLLAPGPGPVVATARPDAAAHYWIDDVTLMSAPSLSMIAAARPSRGATGRLLLLGDAVSPNPDYPELPMASAEMSAIERHFPAFARTVFARQSASPAAYLKSAPAQYAYIHFVTHGVASRTDPLDSAIILSRSGSGEDSFKLHARDIIHHPIHAKLVTVSACYGSGARSYAGEGLVGLSWSFLRAGAQSVIAALWEASDESTPRLMDSLYEGLEDGMAPADALRRAKLALLHSHSRFRKPFFWGSFQIYTA